MLAVPRTIRIATYGLLLGLFLQFFAVATNVDAQPSDPGSNSPVESPGQQEQPHMPPQANRPYDSSLLSLTIDIPHGTWSSGDEIPLTITLSNTGDKPLSGIRLQLPTHTNLLYIDSPDLPDTLD